MFDRWILEAQLKLSDLRAQHNQPITDEEVLEHPELWGRLNDPRTQLRIIERHIEDLE